MEHTYIEQFGELLETYKASKELPNTAINELRRKPNTQFEIELKALFIATIKSVRTETLMECRGLCGKGEKVCAYCLDRHYMQVNGKLQRGCVWCDNGKKKNELEPDQLTDLHPEFSTIRTTIDKLIKK